MINATAHRIALLAALVLGAVQGCSAKATPGAGGAGGSGGAPGFTGSAGCVAELDVGWSGSCVVKKDGTLWCWGDNAASWIDPGGADELRPVQVKGFAGGVTSASVGVDHSCAIDEKGALWCWGSNTVGQLGDGTTGSSSTPRPVVGLGKKVRSVAVGRLSSCAIDRSGALWCWGDNSVGSVGDGTTMDRDAPVRVEGLPGAVEQVSAGTCAVAAGGTVWCWGPNPDGVLGVPITDHGANGDDFTRSPARVSSLEDVAQVSAPGSTVCALKHDGTVWCWGQLELGQATPAVSSATPLQVTTVGPSVVRVATPCALKGDRALWCWGDSDAPAQVAALGAHVVAVGSGSATCALTDDGTVWCWGRNNHGQLGNGTTTDSSLPVKVKLGCP